jgi:hypothetical protein
MSGSAGRPSNVVGFSNALGGACMQCMTLQLNLDISNREEELYSRCGIPSYLRTAPNPSSGG